MSWKVQIVYFLIVGPEYQSQINFELIGCAIKLVSPSPYQPHPQQQSLFVDDHAWLKITLDPSSTAVSPFLSASIVVLLAKCPPSILSASPSLPSFVEEIGFAPTITLNDLNILLIYPWTPGRPQTTASQFCQVDHGFAGGLPGG
ncbi:hypothetical protein VP01_4351g1 [Puccinia sorghi]|uniref:Uncharacterized protein n=1 Tax=Puccinia sorghi TaxID=27349 RepID=A0A0L6UPT7_9BASI|nr:hypothetical protein VP01_4351g1 [Puccinia sorghi]